MVPSAIVMRTTRPSEMFSLSVCLQIVDGAGAFGHRRLALGRHQLGQFLGERDELGRLGHEVGLTPQLHQTAASLVIALRDGPFGCLSVRALDRRGEALFAQPLRAASKSPSVASRARLASSMPDASRLAQGLDIFRSEIRHVLKLPQVRRPRRQRRGAALL